MHSKLQEQIKALLKVVEECNAKIQARKADILMIVIKGGVKDRKNSEDI